jgi:hypothetical protein
MLAILKKTRQVTVGTFLPSALDMIRSRRLPIPALTAWLVPVPVQPVSATRYRLRLWRENRVALAALRADLDSYLSEAFDDARMRLRKGFEDTLSPFTDPQLTIATNSPGSIEMETSETAQMTESPER